MVLLHDRSVLGSKLVLINPEEAYPWIMPRSISAQSHESYAKINLILRVAPPTADGYHPICSWMHAIDLSDQITIELLNSNQPSKFNIHWDTGQPVEWPIQSDLVHQAHKAFERLLGRSIPVRVEVNKSIPAGGGLGGGSSNAATTLMILNELTNAGLNQDQLRTLGHELGTDIPYFINLDSFDARPPRNTPPPPAVVSGIGDHINHTQPITSDLTLLIPNFGCPTPKIYTAFDRQKQHPPPINESSVRSLATKGTLNPETLINDLCLPARSAVLELDRAMAVLESIGLNPHLSGSGSTMFLIGHLDQSTLKQISRACPDIRVIHTRLI